MLQPLDLAADLGHAPRGLLQRAEAALHVADDLRGGVQPRAHARLAGLDQLHPLLELARDLARQRADLATQALLVLAPLAAHALELLLEQSDGGIGRRRLGAHLGQLAPRAEERPRQHGEDDEQRAEQDSRDLGHRRLRRASPRFQ